MHKKEDQKDVVGRQTSKRVSTHMATPHDPATPFIYPQNNGQAEKKFQKEIKKVSNQPTWTQPLVDIIVNAKHGIFWLSKAEHSPHDNLAPAPSTSLSMEAPKNADRSLPWRKGVGIVALCLARGPQGDNNTYTNRVYCCCRVWNAKPAASTRASSQFVANTMLACWFCLYLGGGRQRGGKGTKEQRNKGTKEQRNKRTTEQRNTGTKEQKSIGAKEQRNNGGLVSM